MGSRLMTYPSPWQKAPPPKDQRFLALAFAKGTPDLSGRQHPDVIVAEWDESNHEYRPVKVTGDKITSMDLQIVCWCELPAAPKIE
jgi:hypothetical protein